MCSHGRPHAEPTAPENASSLASSEWMIRYVLTNAHVYVGTYIKWEISVRLCYT